MAATTHLNKSVHSVNSVNKFLDNQHSQLILLVDDLGAPIYWRDLPLTEQNRASGPDSVMVRAFASEAGGAGSNPGRVIPKTLKMVPVATLLGAQH